MSSKPLISPHATRQPQTTKQLQTISGSAQKTIGGRITWQPATIYENGDVLDFGDIAYYQIVYGPSPKRLTQSINVHIDGVLAYEFLAPATHDWYVGVKTVSIYGRRSAISNLVHFRLP